MEKTPGEKLAALLGGALEAKVKEKTDSFGGLLTRDAAIRLLCQENGISTERKLLLSEVRASMLPFSFSARVDRVFPIQQFPGGTLRTVRIHVSDKSGEATLVLWNEQAKLAEGNLLSGDSIECTGAYARSGEIAIGRNGSILRAGNSSVLPVAQLKEGLCNVQGRIEAVEGKRSYLERRTGKEKAMHPFSICSGGKCARAIAWHMPEGGHLPKQGESVVLENAAFRNGEIHLNEASRIVAASSPGSGGKSGKFMGVAIEGSEAIIGIGTEKFRLPIGDAIILLGIVAVPHGVGASTLLSIKSRALEGSAVNYSSECGKLSFLEFEN